ncbi:MAG: cysteine desulfurase NifS [Clostridiales bacterium]|nr:cysteine desulfurase NifS [Clostridiales bacterium]
MKKAFVYADNAATTRVADEVLAAMVPYFSSLYGNPSAAYGFAGLAAEGVEHARAQVAGALGAAPGEVFFTSGGTEADNWALKSGARLRSARGRHIISTAIEHHAVLHSLEALAEEGFEVTLLPVDPDGLLRLEDLERALRDDTILVSCMFANNEIGTVQPVAEIGALCRARDILFHTDAVQAVGHLPIDVVAMNIDLLALSGHKFHAPKGVGALYVRRGIDLPPFVDGGKQERGRRAGTEAVPAIVGLGAAAELATAHFEREAARVAALRDRLLKGILAQVPGARLNGHPTRRLPGNLNLSFSGVEGPSLLALLDSRGICAAAGSACTAGASAPSHVLTAIGLDAQTAQGSLRLSFAGDSTEEDVDTLLELLPPLIARLRAL